MGAIALGVAFTHPKGAIGDTAINTVVHIRLFTFFPIFGTQKANWLIGRLRFRPGALGPSEVMKWHIVTSEVPTELSVQVVLPNAEFKTFPFSVNLGCRAVALANPNVFGDQISEYESSQRRPLLQAENETPLPGQEEEIEDKIQFTGVVDGSVPVSRVAQYGVSPYLVPNLTWDMVFSAPMGL